MHKSRPRRAYALLATLALAASASVTVIRSFINPPVQTATALTRHVLVLDHPAAQRGGVPVEAQHDLVDFYFGVFPARLEGFEHVAQEHLEFLVLSRKGFDAPLAVEKRSQTLRS